MLISYIIYMNKPFFKYYFSGRSKMKETAFIICEYNPFHNGHLLHINQTREAGAKRVICIMSGNFVQRGEIAFCDKITRAGFAIDHGADLVLELPAKYVVSGARYFACGAIETIRRTHIKGTLSFGASAPVSSLMEAARITSLQDVADAAAGLSLSQGITYAAALQKAAGDSAPELSFVFNDPNNILAMEYIKAAAEQKADIDFFSVRRTLMHDKDATEGCIAGAKYLREQVYGNRSLSQIRSFVPENVYRTLDAGYKNGMLPADRSKFSVAAMARLITLHQEDFSSVNGVNQGLENRIYECMKNCSDLYDLFDSVKTKRYTHARIRQILISSVLDIKKSALEQAQPYIRVLGMNETGRGLIKEIRNIADVPVVMNLSEAPDCAEKELDALCGKLFDICRPVPLHKAPEFSAKPYVS